MCVAQFENSITLGSPMISLGTEAERSASQVLDAREAENLIIALKDCPDVAPRAVPDALRRLIPSTQPSVQFVPVFDSNALADKLELLDDSVLQAVIAGARSAYAMPLSFLLTEQGRFAQQALQAAGLAPLSDVVACGLVFVMLPDLELELELAIWHHPHQIDINHDHPPLEVGRGLCDYAAATHFESSAMNIDIAYKMACYLIKKFGKQYLRVVEGGKGDITIAEIYAEELRSDIGNGWRQPLTLAGVTAPAL